MPNRSSAVRTLIAVAITGATIVHDIALAQEAKVAVSLRPVISDKVPRVYRYGGNVWLIPQVFAAGVAEKILAVNPPGLMRISLGDQVLEQTSSLEDLRRRLEHYPLNDFLRKYASEGGRVLLILDGVPRWISSEKSTRRLKDPTQPIFRMSPPADYQKWSKVVEAIVHHFNGRLGLNAYYESWNEPNWYYLGTSEQYMKQYYYTVLGARRADPKALVGGPSVSEFLGTSTRRTERVTEAEKRGRVVRQLRQNFLFKQFLEHAGRTPMPELGLRRLPVDFFSWHSFYIDPTNYYELVVPAIRDALQSAGYRRTTPLINTEWNIAAVPPYPEGDLNANEVGAAFVATSLLAMGEAGVDAQIFQMFVDPGVKGYHGGTFTQTGIPRANFNSFRLFSLVKGNQLRTQSSDQWVKSAAFSDGSRVYLILSTFVPTPKMTLETTRIRSALENAGFLRSLAEAKLEESVLRKQKLPPAFARRAQEIAEANKKTVQREQRKAAAWKNGLTLEIELTDSERPHGKVTHYLIDSSHSNIYKDIARAEQFLAERLRRGAAEVNQRLVAHMRESGIDDANIRNIGAALKNKRTPEEAVATIAPEKRAAARASIERALRESRQLYKQTLDSIESWDSARLYKEAINWPPSGKFRLRSEPYSVHLFVFDQ